MKLEELARLRVAVLGCGREGSSLVRLMTRRYPDCQITAFDEQPVAAPADGVALRIGSLAPSAAEFDVAIRSAGVPVTHPGLDAFRRDGGRVIGVTSLWFAERTDARVIAVTGSKGKSTTASLIAHLLNACGRPTILAGNIGISVIDHIDSQADWWVLELSSYQLADLEGKPEIGVITRLFPEHLDWHGDLESYYGAKLRLANLLGDRPLLINAADPVLERATAGLGSRVEVNVDDGWRRQGDELWCGQERVLAAGQSPLLGRHNLDNLCLALAACEQAGLSWREAAGQVAGFRPLAHRLEPIVDHVADQIVDQTADQTADQDGLRWINDSIATAPHAVRAALEALAPAPVVLIAGGQARPADWSPVLSWCARHPLAGLVVLPDNGDEIAAAFAGAGLMPVEAIVRVADLEAAVEAARQLARPGQTILLSPGAPSFPHFRDFEQRGNRFREQVKGLQ